jgi:TIGR00730 family protein
MVSEDWIEKSHDSWSVFKIMGELVEGYEKLSQLGPCVSIFGSARTKPDDKYYKKTIEISEDIVKLGLGVITGGGPGIMEAANKGAQKAGGVSVGLNIDLPYEQTHNEFIDSDKVIDFDYFFVRKVMFVRYAQAFVVMPGGFGTLDELFEAITLIQTNKIERFPVILYGSDFWSGCIDWIKNTVCHKFNNVSTNEMFLF